MSKPQDKAGNLIKNHRFSLPYEKKEVIGSGNIPILLYRDQASGKDEAVNIIQEGTFRLGVTEFYAQQVADKIYKHIEPSIRKIEAASASYTAARQGGKLQGTMDFPLLPPKDIKEILFKSVPSYTDTSVTEILEQIIPFQGHNQTGRLIGIFVIEKIVNQIRNIADPDIFDGPVDSYVIQVMQKLIESPAWPSSQEVGQRVKATTDKSSPYAARVRVGLDTAAQSAVLTMQAQAASYAAQYNKTREELRKLEVKIAAEKDPKKRSAMMKRFDKLLEKAADQKEKLDVKIRKNVDAEMNRFDSFRSQMRVIQSRVLLAMEEQQIQETRERTESSRRAADWNPLVKLREKLAVWSGGLIGSDYSKQIRSVRFRSVGSRLANMPSNLMIEFLDNMKDNKGIVKSALGALGSVITLKSFSSTIQNVAAQQRGSHDQLVQLAQEVAPTPITDKLDDDDYDISGPGPTSPAGPRGPMPSPVAGTPAADLSEIAEYINDQMRSVVNEVSTTISGYIEGATDRIKGALASITQQLNDKLRDLQETARRRDDDEEIDGHVYEPLGETITDLSDSEAESASRELQVNISKYGGVRRQDWVKILSLLKYLARKKDDNDSDVDLGLLAGRLLPLMSGLLTPLMISGAILGSMYVSRRHGNYGRARTLQAAGGAGSAMGAGAGSSLAIYEAQQQSLSPSERSEQLESQADRARRSIRLREQRRERITRGTASIGDRITDFMMSEDYQRAQDALDRRTIERAESGRTEAPSDTKSTSPKRFNRQSKFADLGLNLEDHSSVGG